MGNSTVGVRAADCSSASVVIVGKDTSVSRNFYGGSNNTLKPGKNSGEEVTSSTSRRGSMQTFLTSVDAADDFEEPTGGSPIVEIPTTDVKSSSLKNRVDPNFPISQCYKGLTTFRGDQKYVENFLLQLTKEINSEGKAPLLLRPLAWIFGLFGLRGVFQTNCTSTATAIVETLQTGVLHRAISDLRGADIKHFSCVGTRGSESVLITGFLNHFKSKITTPPGVNDCGIITLQRPRWYKWLGFVGKHAIAFAKIDSHLYLMDPQKKKLWSLNLRKNISTSASGEAEKFLGSLNGKDDSIQVYHLDLPKKLQPSQAKAS